MQTLSSLHVLIAESRNPSPSAIRKLTLRYALDARKLIESLLHFCWKRVPEEWWINFYGLDVREGSAVRHDVRCGPCPPAALLAGGGLLPPSEAEDSPVSLPSP